MTQWNCRSFVLHLLALGAVTSSPRVCGVEATFFLLSTRKSFARSDFHPLVSGCGVGVTRIYVERHHFTVIGLPPHLQVTYPIFIYIYQLGTK